MVLITQRSTSIISTGQLDLTNRPLICRISVNGNLCCCFTLLLRGRAGSVRTGVRHSSSVRGRPQNYDVLEYPVGLKPTMVGLQPTALVNLATDIYVIANVSDEPLRGCPSLLLVSYDLTFGILYFYLYYTSAGELVPHSFGGRSRCRSQYHPWYQLISSQCCEPSQFIFHILVPDDRFELPTPCL